MTANFLGVNAEGKYRVVAEEKILRSLVGAVWFVQARAGALEWALGQAAATLDRWVRLGLPHAVDRGRRLFDPCEVANFALYAHRAGLDSFYEDVGIPVFRAVVTALNPIPTHQSGDHAAGNFVLRWRREFDLRGSPRRRVLRLRLPLPLEGHGNCLHSVRLVEPLSAVVSEARIPGRFEATLPADDLPERVALEVEIHLTAWARSWCVDAARLEDWDQAAPEYRLYVQPSEGLIRVTPSVASLAEALAGSCRNPWDAIHRFWKFFFDRMNKGFIHHDELDRADPLGSLVRRGWFDCYTGSSLLVALCRARGIPARLVSGLMLYQPGPSPHYWVEVLLPPLGWLPFDLLCYSLAAARLEAEPWSSAFLGRLDQRMTGECLPRLTLGPPAVRFPPSWYYFADFNPDGSDVGLYDPATAEFIYRDLIQIRREPPDEAI